MENKKAKKFIIAMIIILLLVCLGVVVWQYIEIKNTEKVFNTGDKTNQIENIQQEQQNVGNKQPENEKNEQPTNKTEENEQKYNKASDLIEDLVHKNNPITNNISGTNYKLDMVLPTFKIKTEATQKINEKIQQIYNTYSNDYLSSEVTKTNTRNTKISYVADMNNSTGILTLKITIAYTDWAGTGTPNGSSVVTYKYDFVNDKIIYNEVSDLIEDFYHYGNPIEKHIDENLIYKLDMVLPTFKIQTEATQKINEKIQQIYSTYLNDYLSSEITKTNTRNTKISYVADMNNSTGILALKITIAYTDWAGTGEPNGSSVITYKYDFINDKIIE